MYVCQFRPDQLHEPLLQVDFGAVQIVELGGSPKIDALSVLCDPAQVVAHLLTGPFGRGPSVVTPAHGHARTTADGKGCLDLFAKCETQHVSVSHFNFRATTGTSAAANPEI